MQGKLVKMRVPFAVVTALAAHITWAGPPVAFGNWNANGGQIGSPCPNGFSCVTVVDGGGMLQRELIEQGTGRQFMQTIMTDPNATGSPQSLGFADENFIQLMGPGGSAASSGISASQRVADGAAFESAIVFNRGWAAEPGTGGDGNISQVLRDPGNPALATDDFESRFAFQGVANEAGARAGRRVEIGQTLGLNQGGTSELNNWQVMHMVVMEGDLQTTAGEAGLPGAGNISWEAGDDIVAGWVGQVFQTPLGPGTEPSAFGHQAFMNQSTGQQAVFNSLSETGPFAWPDPFGPAPSLPTTP